MTITEGEKIQKNRKAKGLISDERSLNPAKNKTQE